MSNEFSLLEREKLLQIARETILKKDKSIWISQDDITNFPQKFKEKRGGFVTIHKNGDLRGCIGYILPYKKLYETVIENAYNAAYGDPRFPPVTVEEIANLQIEISILTIPAQLDYSDREDLINKLVPLQDGVIISKSYQSATFLPQVWDQLATHDAFLSHLCLKAGLNKSEWESGELIVETYQAEVFTE